MTGNTVVTENGQSTDRSRIQALLTAEPLASGYRSTLPQWSLWAQESVPQLYLLRDIELMLTHPVCTSALNFYKGGISLVDFEIKTDNTEVGEFIHEQCKRFWDRGVPLLQGGYEYGWIGLENMFSDEDGPMKWDHLLQFNPRDCFLLTQDYKPIGVRVKNVRSKGNVDLWLASKDVPAKGLWYAHNPRYNAFYGQSQLQGSWRPWRRLAWRDGAETVIDTGVYRFAFSGPVVGYPDESMQPSTGPAGAQTTATTVDTQGRPIKHARDVARQICEWAKTGAGIGLLSTKYPSDMGGGDKWTLEWPKHVLDPAPLVGYAKYLHDQIYYGIGVPPELLAASESGSGYSGRSIPMEAFITQQQRLADAILWLFVRQVLKPLVRWNWGDDIQWDVKVKPLLETKRAAMGGASNEKPPAENMPPEGMQQMPGPGVGLPGQNAQPPGQEPSPYRDDNKTDQNKGGRGKTLFGKDGTQGPAFSFAEPPGLRWMKNRKKKPVSAAFGMVGDEWHGPEAPGPGWTQVGQGERGGKVWKKTGETSRQEQPTAQPTDPKKEKKEKAHMQKAWGRLFKELTEYDNDLQVEHAALVFKDMGFDANQTEIALDDLVRKEYLDVVEDDQGDFHYVPGAEVRRQKVIPKATELLRNYFSEYDGAMTLPMAMEALLEVEDLEPRDRELVVDKMLLSGEIEEFEDEDGEIALRLKSASGGKKLSLGENRVKRIAEQILQGMTA